MIAGIFAAHGLKYGVGGETRGYKSFENQRLKYFLKDMGYKAGYEFPGWVPDLGGTAELVKELNIDLFKVGVEYWRPLEALGATPVKIKRKIENVARSVTDKNGHDYDEAVWWVKKRYEMLDSIPGPTVLTDDVIKGDYSTLKEAFDWCDIEFNEDHANKVIDPEMWHYAA